MPRRKPKQKAETKSTRVVRARVDYVLECIRDQPWLDGNRRALRRHVMERFVGTSESTASRAVSDAYTVLDEARAENARDLVGFLDRVHRKTIELGQRNGDGRVITPAAAELRKLHGVGEPDRVQHSGAIQGGGGVTSGDRLLLEALKLTNAQRLAQIDQLKAELSADSVAAAAQAIARDENDLTVPEDEEPSGEQQREDPGDEFSIDG